MLPAFTLKYKIRLLLICLSIIMVELSLLTVWSRANKRKSDNDITAPLPASKNVTVQNKTRLKTAKNDQIRKRDEVKPVNSITKVKEDSKGGKVDKEDADAQIQNLLSPFVSDSLGRILNVEFQSIRAAKDEQESTDILDIVYRQAKHGVNILEPKVELSPPLARRYVYVYERYWEQLTMNTRVLMALASQAKIGGRFVVEPKVKDSSFGDTGYPLNTYFNVAQMNTLLSSNGYSTFVTEDEFNTECSKNDQFHAILHFLYEDDKAVPFLKSKFGITTEQYDKISRRAKRVGWTNCQFLKPYFSPGLKVFCVDPTIITEWSVLERGILRDIKCLGIFVWRGIGFKTRTSFSENHINVSSKEIHFLLEPSLSILNEAEIFTESHLRTGSGYIAVQVRGEKVVIQHNLTRLKKCLRLLVNVIKNTKKSFGISKVFVATDMSDFGSGSWAGSSKTKDLDAHALKIIQSTLMTRIDAVVYKPSADWRTPDRGAVSLVELSIIARAQHLLTIGTGSFQEWAVAKFLKFHKDDDPQLWSLTRLCSLP